MSTRTVRGPFPEYGSTAAAAGCRRGVALVMGSTNITAVPATAIGQGKYRGVQIDEGALPNGAANYGQSATQPAEQINAQKEGIAWGLAAAASTPVMGDQAICDASAQFITRVPYSFSAFVYGQFDESRTVGSNPELVGIELLPQYIEVVRNVTCGGTGALGAATKYGTYVAGAASATAVPLFMAAFTGQKIRNLAAGLTTAPAGVDTVIFTVMTSVDFGANWVDTVVTCTTTGTAFASYDLTHSATLTKGMLVALKAVSSGATAAGITASFDIV